MFTDVKNCTGTEIPATQQQQQAIIKPNGFKKRLFGPLLRILRYKTNKSNKRQQHPNNLNLNNCDADAVLAAETPASTFIDDYVDIIKKAAIDEEFLRSYYEIDPFTLAAEDVYYPYGDNKYDNHNLRSNQYQHEKCISDKQRITDSAVCVHAEQYRSQQRPADFNDCCHIEYPGFPSTGSTRNRFEHQEEDIDGVVPVNYIRTGAGTFFWTTAQNKYDDDLIDSIYCSSLVIAANVPTFAPTNPFR